MFATPLLLALASLPNGSGADPDSVLVIYDLNACVPAVSGLDTLAEEAFVPPLLPIEGWSGDEDGDERQRVDRDTGAIARLIGELLGDELEQGGRELSIDRLGRLVVTAPPELQAKVRATLTFFEEAFDRSLDVRVDVVELEPGLAPIAARLSPAEADAVIAAAKGSEVFTARVPTGAVQRMDASRELHLVTDYSPEVAQGVFALDPELLTYAVGTRLSVAGVPAAGGAHLRLIARIGDRGTVRSSEARQKSLIVTERGSETFSEMILLQRLEHVGHAFAASTFLRSDEVLALDAGADVMGGASRRVLFVRLLAPPPEPSPPLVVGDARLEVLDLGILDPPRITVAGRRYQEGFLPRAFSPETITDQYTTPSLVARISRGGNRIARDVGFAAARGGYDTLGPWIVDVERSDDAPALASAVSAIAPPTTFDLTLRLTRGTSDAPIAFATASVVAGDPLVISTGAGNTQIVDQSAEIANQATVSNPIAGVAFDGLVAVVRPTLAPSGNLRLRVSARAHVRTGEVERLELGAPMAGPVDQAPYANLFVDEQLLVEPGGPRTFQLGTSGGELGLSVDVR